MRFTVFCVLGEQLRQDVVNSGKKIRVQITFTKIFTGCALK